MSELDEKDIKQNIIEKKLKNFLQGTINYVIINKR